MPWKCLNANNGLGFLGKKFEPANSLLANEGQRLQLVCRVEEMDHTLLRSIPPQSSSGNFSSDWVIQKVKGNSGVCRDRL